MKPTTMRSTVQNFTIRILFVCLFVFGLAQPVSDASAALRGCRTDPILFFSDGSMLTATATIYTDDSNIVQVLYTVHAPVGLQVVRTVYTANALGGRETVEVIADQAPGVYQVDTLVITQEPGVAVEASSYLRATRPVSVNGFDGEHLMVTLFAVP